MENTKGGVRERSVCVGGDPVGPCGLFDDFALYSN